MVPEDREAEDQAVQAAPADRPVAEPVEAEAEPDMEQAADKLCC